MTPPQVPSRAKRSLQSAGWAFVAAVGAALIAAAQMRIVVDSNIMRLATGIGVLSLAGWPIAIMGSFVAQSLRPLREDRLWPLVATGAVLVLAAVAVLALQFALASYHTRTLTLPAIMAAAFGFLIESQRHHPNAGVAQNSEQRREHRTAIKLLLGLTVAVVIITYYTGVIADMKGPKIITEHNLYALREHKRQTLMIIILELVTYIVACAVVLWRLRLRSAVSGSS